MIPRNVSDEVAFEAQRWVPEAVSVLVVSEDGQIAREVGPMLASSLYPGRRFGSVLHIESDPEGRGLLVAVEVH